MRCAQVITITAKPTNTGNTLFTLNMKHGVHLFTFWMWIDEFISYLSSHSLTHTLAPQSTPCAVCGRGVKTKLALTVHRCSQPPHTDGGQVFRADVIWRRPRPGLPAAIHCDKFKTHWGSASRSYTVCLPATSWKGWKQSWVRGAQYSTAIDPAIGGDMDTSLF